MCLFVYLYHKQMNTVATSPRLIVLFPWQRVNSFVNRTNYLQAERRNCGAAHPQLIIMITWLVHLSLVYM